ncbi:GNAT family N-acetyltransferase [Paenibacillus ihuae]|uniref:GNAT family N-acetyltransferase n=1 Tax=Paenibacillus ihuae TaxID=1232431 RepID=UPI0009E9B842|nr:GNAT family N-acetyltransferase [Paenibacillus ihuae]
MQVTTERLIITAFSQENYKKVSETYSIGKHIVNYLDNLKEDTELLGWGVWFVYLNENNQVIGDIGFKGKPDSQGTVEVGFGIIPEMHNKGIATESVGAIIEWALSSRKVKKIVAECLIDNLPSIKVLEKLKMTRTGIKNGMINWEILNDHHC